MALIQNDMPPAILHTLDVQWLNRRVKQAGLTYTALGLLTGRNPSTVRNWLVGLADPPSSWVCALAVVLDLDHPGELFRPVTETDVGIEVRPLMQVRPASRRRRLARIGSAVSPPVPPPAKRVGRPRKDGLPSGSPEAKAADAEKERQRIANRRRAHWNRQPVIVVP